MRAMIRWRIVAWGLFVVMATGCGDHEATEEPGARGPVIVRWWDRGALERHQPPTVVTAQRLAETGKRFSALALEPVRIHHPLEDGQLWLDAPSGAFDQGAAAQRLHCPGPVQLHGWIQGRPFCGAASEARVQAGGTALELTDVVMVHDGHMLTTPLMALERGLGHATGPVAVRAGAPAVVSALAAIP